MLRPCVTVLAEDKSTKGDGLHSLVSACVLDQIGGDRWHLRDSELDWRFLGSNQSVLEACKRIGRTARYCRAVVALLDSDRIRQALKLETGASTDQVLQSIRGGSDDPDRLHVFLLERNAETVVKAVARCAPGQVPEAGLARALSKDRLARDLILRTAAFAVQQVRDCVLQEVPSLHEVVRFLADSVQTCRRARSPGPGVTPQAPA